jgi:hypothetical protein
MINKKPAIAGFLFINAPSFFGRLEIVDLWNHVNRKILKTNRSRKPINGLSSYRS